MWFIKIADRDLKDPQPKQIHWRRVKDKDYQPNDMCYNISNGFCPVSFFQVLELVEADGWVDLSWKDTYLDPTKREFNGTGWMNRNGKIYPCGWMEHIDVAECYFKKSDEELLNLGWVKLHRGVDIPVYRVDRLTQAQADKLRDLGYQIDDDDITQLT